MNTENDTIGNGIKAKSCIRKHQIIHVQMLLHPVPSEDIQDDRYYVKHYQHLFALDPFGSTINHSCNPNVVMEKWEIPSQSTGYDIAIVF